MVNSHGRFVWYELMTTDMEAAKAFYASVVGWGARDASVRGSTFSVFTVGGSPVAALMNVPEDARRMGATPQWIGYVGVDDVDAAVDHVKQSGGRVYVRRRTSPTSAAFRLSRTRKWRRSPWSRVWNPATRDPQNWAPRTLRLA